MKSSVAEALADAFEHNRQGRLSEAEVRYRQVLQIVPDQPDALHRLGMRYPGDPGMENLDNWDVFEAEFPDTFAGMYIFWVQKDHDPRGPGHTGII